VSKATGVPLARIAARCMVGETLALQGVTGVPTPSYYSVKEAVFPFIKFPGVDSILGPEMKSTGEVMGIGENFGEAFAKAQLGAGNEVPRGGLVFISVRDADKTAAVAVARALARLGFSLCATPGTAAAVREAGLECAGATKAREGQPHIVDMLTNDEIDLIVNTTEGRKAVADSFSIRRTALHHKVFYTTTMAGARASIQALDVNTFDNVNCLQELHSGVA